MPASGPVFEPVAAMSTVNPPKSQIRPEEGASRKASIGFRLWQPGAVALVLSIGATAAGATGVPWPWPVPTDPPAITGTYMETRQTRFHTGMDIRTAGRTGWPVLSPVDGEVRRIRCSPRGYGVALYVEARSGETVVFAHLDRLFAGAADLLRDAQAESGRYEQDFRVEPGGLAVRRGQVVALSGETGTGAPHLHFEVRDAAQRTLNPARYLAVPDTVAPTIEALRLVATVPGAGAELRIGPGTQRVAATGEWSVEALVKDRTGYAPFGVAPASVALYVDGGLSYRMSNEALAFDQTDQARLDLHVDREGRWYRLSRREGSTLPGRTGPGGFVRVADRAVELDLVVEDVVGRRTSRHLVLDPGRPPDPVTEAGLEVQEFLVVARYPAGSEMPPLLEGPDTYYLLEPVPGGWRVEVPLAALSDGLWKLVNRGEKIESRYLGFAHGGIGRVVLGEDRPVLEATPADRLYPGGALQLRGVSVEATPELRPVGAGLELLSFGLVPRDGLRLEFPGAVPEHAMLMRFDGKRWRPISGGGPERDRGETAEFGVVAVMEDLEPPVIGEPTGAPVLADGTYRILWRGPSESHGVPLPEWNPLLVPVTDQGSGLPDTGPEVRLDGRAWPARYDGERDRLLLDWFVPATPGTHELEIVATDRSGRRTQRAWRLRFDR
jgi:hypothetical protein